MREWFYIYIAELSSRLGDRCKPVPLTPGRCSGSPFYLCSILTLMCVTPADNASTSTSPKKLKFVINTNSTPDGIKFITDDNDNGAEIRNKNLNPEYIPLVLSEKKKRKKKSWLEKKQSQRW